MDDQQSKLVRARAGEAQCLGELFETHRAILVARAERQLGLLLQRRVSPSDVVQQSFIDALSAFGRFEGSSSEFVAWLQSIVDHQVEHVVRDHTTTQKRSIHREEALDGSAVIGGDLLATGDPSPSAGAMLREETNRLADLMGQLPADQRLAVQLRSEGNSLAEIAVRMERSTTAVAGLIKRGMQQLRRLFQTEDEVP